MKKNFQIAIDGHSSCGKSTLAKALAKKLTFVYVDSGAMYRAVTLYFLRHNLDWNDPLIVERALSQINIRFARKDDGLYRTLLNGEDVEDEIRQMHVSNAVSPVAAVSAVRRAMVLQQQAMGKEENVVMDGRDIGTVVFPQADLKIFLTASPDERARRRYNELKQKGKDVSLEEIRQNLIERDHIDSTREDSPLRQAEDAILVDNTHITEEEQLDLVLQYFNQVG